MLALTDESFGTILEVVKAALVRRQSSCKEGKQKKETGKQIE